MRQCLGVFDTAGGSDVFTFDACGVIAYVLTTGVDLGHQVANDFRMLVEYIGCFPNVCFQIVEFSELDDDGNLIYKYSKQ